MVDVVYALSLRSDVLTMVEDENEGEGEDNNKGEDADMRGSTVTQMEATHHPVVSSTLEPSIDLLATLTLYADVSRVVQIVRNLVTNAIKFTPRGKKVTLKTSVHSVDALPHPRSTHNMPPEETGLVLTAALCIQGK